MAGLRALLFAGPSRKTWHELGEHLDQWPDDGSLQMGLDYALAHLEAWPDEMRHNRGRAWSWFVMVMRGERNPRATLLRSARLKPGSFHGGELRTIIDAGAVSHLRQLDLGGVRLGPTGFKRLAAGSPFVALERLSLADNWLGDAHAELLATCGAFPALVALNLASNRLTAPGAATLLTEADLPSLRALDLSHNPLGIIDPILRAPALERLHRLALADAQVSRADTEALLTCGRLGGLVSLELRRCNVSPRILGDPALAEILDGLEHLGLAQNPLGVEGVRQLLSHGRLGQLRSLDLAGCRLDDAALELLMSCEGIGSLVSLDLAGNRISSRGAELLSRVPLVKLERLELASNDIEDEGARALTRANMPALVHLNLQNNPLSDQGVFDLLDASTHPMSMRTEFARLMLFERLRYSSLDPDVLLGLVVSERIPPLAVDMVVKTMHEGRIRTLARHDRGAQVLSSTSLPIEMRQMIMQRMTVPALEAAARSFGTEPPSRVRRTELLETLGEMIFGSQ